MQAKREYANINNYTNVLSYVSKNSSSQAPKTYPNKHKQGSYRRVK